MTHLYWFAAGSFIILYWCSVMLTDTVGGHVALTCWGYYWVPVLKEIKWENLWWLSATTKKTSLIYLPLTNYTHFRLLFGLYNLYLKFQLSATKAVVTILFSKMIRPEINKRSHCYLATFINSHCCANSKWKCLHNVLVRLMEVTIINLGAFVDPWINTSWKIIDFNKGLNNEFYILVELAHWGSVTNDAIFSSFLRAANDTLLY